MNSSGASCSVHWDGVAISNIKRNFMRGMIRMGNDMANRARYNAPYLTGALRNSIRVSEAGASNVIVMAGGEVGRFSVPYARRREFENNAHPSTRYYMTRAFNSVVDGDITQYFKEIAK